MAVITADFDPRAVSVPVRPPDRVLWGVVLLALAIIGLCTEVAYVLAAREPDQWAAQSEIEYRGAAWVETADRIMKSPTLIAPIAQAEGYSLSDFQARLTAGQVAGTEVLVYQFQSEDPQQALRIVTALTDTYLATYDTTTSGADTQAFLRSQLQTLQQQLTDAQNRLSALPVVPAGTPSPLVDDIQSEIANLRLQIAGVNDMIVQAELDEIELTENRPKVVTEPRLLTEPVAPVPEKRALFGAVAGTLLASVVAFVVLRRSVR